MTGPLIPATSTNLMHDFTFTRLRYDSGDWWVDERMPANVLDSLLRYTTLDVDQHERLLTFGDPALLDAPFSYCAGHRLFELDADERRNLERYVENGGFLFADDCNHDVDGLFARSFEAEVAAIFGAGALRKLPKGHGLYHSFFHFEDGPPTTTFELNGWGDDLVHDYLKAVEVDGRIAILYSNKDYGCEWDYDWRNKRWLAEDNTKFAINVVMYALTA